MAVIHVLDKHTAELIAAGEVVERPASVVKELVENAIDAGATQVTVTIERGGVALIQIADNGSGIEPEYIPTAFIRHATSKIATETDLDSIHTLGFRGEALASIASVSRVSLLTKTQQAEFASLYRIDGGEEQGIEPAARGEGTTITVQQLFYNTPARMKFLKKDTSEGNTVAETVGRLALSHPEIAFSFIREGKTQFQTPGDGQLLAAAYAVLTRDFAHNLVPVNYTENNCTVTGLVTPPKNARASRSMQYFYINHRYVKNRTMMAALEQAYRGVMMQGHFPGCVLFLTMPPEMVDVNVHPAKTEVRFANEKEVFDMVYKAVRSVLLSAQSTEKELTFAPAETPQATSAQVPGNTPLQPVQAYSFISAPKQPAVPSAQPKMFSENGSVMGSGVTVPYQKEAPLPMPAQPAAPSVFMPDIGEAKIDIIAENISAAPVRADDAQPKAVPQTQPIQTSLLQQEETPAVQPLYYVGEVFNTYIIAQRGEDICFIDKHAAHERSIYEKLCQSKDNAAAQMLLSPITVQLSAEEKSALAENEDLLAENGIEAEDFGGNAMVLRSVPADVVPDDAENLLIELARRLADHQKDTLNEKTQWVMHSISCRAAIKAGDKNNAAHLVELARQVLDGEIPPFCPHGRPVLLKLTKKELEKQFGRLG